MRKKSEGLPCTSEGRDRETFEEGYYAMPEPPGSQFARICRGCIFPDQICKGGIFDALRG